MAKKRRTDSTITVRSIETGEVIRHENEPKPKRRRRRSAGPFFRCAACGNSARLNVEGLCKVCDER